VPPLVGELEEQCAARGVLSVLGRASAVVGVTIIELSEEHGSLPGGAEGGPTLPSAITLAGRSRDAAVQFSSAVLIFVHFLDDGGLAAASAAPVLARLRADSLNPSQARREHAVAPIAPPPNGCGQGWRGL
jgi:hypothetical protein